ncbi:FGGY-family carbohydrate kinase [Shinella curvata]|uniref:FGGY-family carbohydrate kinase n=1 Tax=Shinella curvata TaxID=1817964 RepID=A0ABT8XBL6_9HYPH|nr:FGGY-family carbohydrate kinase [Shinella curvata]MCJ8054044.1 FGGY-family carbohydrate kinase [Shinella curvata]MDO6121066.1 FGGY-family carbohydrate kinase [Shinella curvata]
MKTIAVVDIGKTNAKVVLVDGETFREVAARTMPNGVVNAAPYPHFDTEKLWAFIIESLAALNAERPIDAISVTTHGATAALVGEDGGLVLPVLDYEHEGPQEAAEAYRKIRPPFAESGTPIMPMGLNAGLQIYWQSTRFPEAFARTRHILMYAQYWSFRLTGVAASEVTSLGCHADLWEPRNGRFSSLVKDEGWTDMMPPVRKAGDTLGPILPEIAAAAGLRPDTPVFCGIHDSNASLLPYVLTRKAPYAVVSTGTWVVVMAIGAKPVALDEARDTLINVNALGDPVPSSRFMGGRAFSTLGGKSGDLPASAIAAVLDRDVMLLPSMPEESGPYPGRKARWTVPRDALSDDEAQAVIAFHLALMTATCLDLVGADGPVIVEGPFAANRAFLMMLGVATGRDVLAGGSATGTSIGAACLAAGCAPEPALVAVTQDLPPGAAGYAARWRALADKA